MEKRIVKKYNLLEYDGEKIKNINWEKVYDGTYNPLACINDEALRHFWDILLDERIVSLDDHGNFGLFNNAFMFCGPRSGNSGAPLFFINVKDAREYKIVFFLKHGIQTTAVVEMNVVG